MQYHLHILVRSSVVLVRCVEYWYTNIKTNTVDKITTILKVFTN